MLFGNIIGQHTLVFLLFLFQIYYNELLSENEKEWEGGRKGEKIEKGTTCCFLYISRNLYYAVTSPFSFFV